MQEGKLVDMPAGRQAGGHDKLVDRYAGRQAGGHASRKTSWWTCWQGDMLVDMLAGRQAGGHAERKKRPANTGSRTQLNSPMSCVMFSERKSGC